jgi:hypothetical protein
MKRIITLTETDLTRIVRRVIEEQTYKLNSDGTYTLKNTQTLSLAGTDADDFTQKATIEGKPVTLTGDMKGIKIKIPTGTILSPAADDKHIMFDGHIDYTRGNETLTQKLDGKFSMTCGDVTGMQSGGKGTIMYHNNKKLVALGSPEGFVKTILTLFCDGTKLKKRPVVDNQIVIPANQHCTLSGDKEWTYAFKNNNWYASKDKGIKWIKLDSTKYASAIEKLKLGATRKDGSPCMQTLG